MSKNNTENDGVDNSLLINGAEVEARTGLDMGKQKLLIGQIQTEFKYSQDFMKPKWEEWYSRLKLYNNQLRDKKAVGDTLMYTTFQTIFSAVYTDQLDTEFIPREEGDVEKAENINVLAEFDYEEMKKSKLDFFWVFDALFFGRGLVSMIDFDIKTKTPVPELIDPMVFYRDPNATSINGDQRGRGGMRFGGKQTLSSLNQLRLDNRYFGLNGISGSGSVAKEEVKKAQEARQSAQGLSTSHQLKNLTKDQNGVVILEWLTVFDGKKTLVTTDVSMTKIIRFNVFKNQSYWGIVDRSFSPMSHDWDGVSVPDICEDKQRARAVLKNLSLRGIEYALYPMYAYNSHKIKNPASLNVEFNKHIAVDGDPNSAIVPAQRMQVPNSAEWMLGHLDRDAQDATATSALQQGNVSESRKTATELDIVTQRASARFSLTSKVFGWSEQEFWRQWFGLYKLHFKAGIGEKIVRLRGVTGTEWRGLSPDDIISKADPDIIVRSKSVSQAEKNTELQKAYNLRGILTNEPGVNKRFLDRKIASLSGMKIDEINRVFPQSYDELLADDENKKLQENKPVPISIRDEHEIHIEVHRRAGDSDANKTHIEKHKAALLLIKRSPELLPQQFLDEKAAAQQSQEKGIPTQVQQSIDFSNQSQAR